VAGVEEWGDDFPVGGVPADEEGGGGFHFIKKPTDRGPWALKGFD
jgi:hypothetical protein